MAEINRAQKIKVITLFIILASAMTTGFLLSRHEDNQIDKYKKECTGVVIDVYSQNSRGETCEYQFEVNNKDYTGHQSL